MQTEQIAKVAHTVNKFYCQSLGDMSQLDWEDAPQWQKDSAVNGVKLHIADPIAGPAASHLAWSTEKVETGWTHGPIKDFEKKEHPCLVAFEDLPKEQQAKDFIFMAVVHSLKDL